MRYHHFIIEDEEIVKYKGQIGGVPSGFIAYPSTLSGENIYYKIVDDKITEAIGEAMHEEAARRRVGDFLSAFLADPPGGW